jgi:hypothetical protein
VTLAIASCGGAAADPAADPSTQTERSSKNEEGFDELVARLAFCDRVFILQRDFPGSTDLGGKDGLRSALLDWRAGHFEDEHGTCSPCDADADTLQRRRNHG